MLFCFLASTAWAQKEIPLSFVGKSQYVSEKVAIDEDNMIHAYTFLDGSSYSQKVDFYYFEEGEWKFRNSPLKLTGQSVNEPILDVDIHGRLAVVGIRNTQNDPRGGFAAVFRQNDNKAWVHTDFEYGLDQPGYGINVEIYDTGSPSTSRLAIGAPFVQRFTREPVLYTIIDYKNSGVVTAYGFNANYEASPIYSNPVNYTLNLFLQGSFQVRSYEIGSHIAISETYLAFRSSSSAGDAKTYIQVFNLISKKWRVHEWEGTMFNNEVQPNNMAIANDKYLVAEIPDDNGTRRIAVYNLDAETLDPDSINSPGNSDNFGVQNDIIFNPDDTTYYLATSAPSDDVSSSDDNFGAVYLYKSIGTGDWTGKNHFLKVENESRTNGLQLGLRMSLGRAGLFAQSAGKQSFFFDFTPDAPKLVSQTSNVSSIQLNWKDNTPINPSEFTAKSYSVISENGSLLSKSDDQSFTDQANPVAGQHRSYKIIAHNAFGSSEPTHISGYFPGDGEISGTVKAPQENGGAPLGDVQINIPQPNSYLRFPAPASVSNYVMAEQLQEFPQNEVTVEFWARPTAGFTNGRSIFSYAAEGTDFGNTLLLDVFQSKLRVYFNNSNMGQVVDVIPNEWHHYAISWDGNTLKAYRDGEKLTERTPSNPGPIPGGGTLVLGQEQDAVGGGFDATQAYVGDLDELRIWKKARTDQEIMRNYRSMITTDATNTNDDLYLNYRFNENRNTALKVAFDQKAEAPQANFHPGLIMGGLSYLTATPPPLNLTAVTAESTGAYAFKKLVYGNGKNFTVIPDDENGSRGFEPGSRTVTLDSQQKTVNNTDFIDTSYFSIAGRIYFDYEGQEIPSRAINVYIKSEANGLVLDSVKTDASGNFTTTLQPGNYIIEPKYADHSFNSNSKRISIPADFQTSVDFINTTRRTLSGKFVGGSCDINVGGATLEVNYAGINKTVSTQLISGIHTFSLEDLPALTDDSVSLEIKSLSNPDLILEKIIVGEGGFLDAEQFAHLDSSDALVNFFYRSPTQWEISSPQLEEITCGEDLYLMSEDDEITLTLEAFEFYGDQRCDIDSAQIIILDDISDRADSIMYITQADSTYTYTLKAGNPNLVGGGNRPYQKALQIDLNVPGGRTVSKTLWAVVQGSTPRVGQPFISVNPANIPLMVLRDPPGDRSFSYLEEGFTLSRGIELTDGGSGSLGVSIAVGDRDDTPAWAEGSMEVGFQGADSRSVEMRLSTSSRISTASDGMPGKSSDVFVGTNMNILYGLTDVLTYNPDICKPTLSQQITWYPGRISSTYIYTYNEIVNSQIPRLQSLIDIETDQKKKDSLQAAISDWNRLVRTNDYISKYTSYKEKETLSFGAEVGAIERAQTVSKIKTDSYFFTATLDVGVEFGFNATVPIPFVGMINTGGTTFSAKAGYQYTEAGSSSQEQTYSVGYTLDDDDNGDEFLVDITTNLENNPLFEEEIRTIGTKIANTPLTNTTPTFRLIGGRSSAPWEGLPSVPRDSAQINVSPRRQANVAADEEAVFTLNVGNLSQSGEERDIVVRLISGTNPDGLILTSGSGSLSSSSGVVLEDVAANDSRTITFTAKRGPIAYRYEDIAIVAYSPSEFMATDGSQALSDTAFFSVNFDAPCEAVSIFRPEEGWVVNQSSNDSLRVIIDSYQKNVINKVGLQIRRLPVGDWRTIRDIPASEIGEDFTALFVNVADFQDGSYQFRAVTECQNGQNYSEVYTGTIDRKAPETLDLPLPDDGVLSPDELIAVTFNEDIDPASITASNVILTNTTTGDTLTTEFRFDERRIIIDLNHAVASLENQLIQVNLRGISDINGNVIAPLKWSFIINQNPVSWERARVVEYMQEGENYEFDARIINGGLTTEKFEITQLPNWLELITQRDSVFSGESMFISFRVKDPAALASAQVYQENIQLKTTSGTETLELYLEVGCPAPAWTVNPSAYSYSMLIHAGIYADLLSYAEPNDLIAAFVGNELRGTTEVFKLVPNDEYVGFLTIYSNVASGETINFRLWDASECEVLDLEETISFDNNSALGSPQQLERLSVEQADYQEIPLKAGVNWISLNLQQADMSPDKIIKNVNLKDGSILSSKHGEFAQFASFVGWQGTLKQLRPGEMYKLTVPQDTLLRLKGKLAKNQLKIQSGWNAIGLLKKEATPLSQALQNFAPSEGDIIRSQAASASFTGGSWQGSLQTLVPGEGYILKSGTAGSLTFARTSSHPSARTHNQAPWTVNPAEFEQYMNITAVLELDGVEYHADDVVIGAFVGDECRGFAQPIQVLNRWVYFLTVYGNTPDEALEFRMYKNGEESVLDQNQSFMSDAALGQVRNPFIFSRLNPEVLRTENFAPSAILLSDSTLQSGQANNTIGILLAEDENLNDFHSFQLISGEGSESNNLFSINGDQLLNNEAISFDPSGSNLYPIRVKAIDQAGQSIERSFTIRVLNAANRIPTAISLTNNTLLFDQDPGTLIGRLNAADEDEFDVHTFTVLSVNKDAASDLFYVDGNELRANVVFTELMIGEYELVILVDDGNGGRLQQTLTVNVSDQVTNIEENISGELSISDFRPNPTNGQGSFTYYLPSASKVTIRLTDMLGRVWQKYEKEQMAGSYQMSLDLSSLPQGVYLYSLETEGENSLKHTRRVIKY
ncbi:MAG: LamG-like jellyroll fold domain-containing protein [Cyclobacteriaceae bacterium]